MPEDHCALFAELDYIDYIMKGAISEQSKVFSLWTATPCEFLNLSSDRFPPSATQQ